ncbi:MAG: hypothetical protein IIC71_07505 [Acidobacteria bacterium]|nr:hypothetical protein [Acidobacteriota bacterium]
MLKTIPRLGSMPLLVKVFVTGTAVMAFLALLGFVVNPDWDLVKVGEENNIPTWFSSVQLFAIGAVLSIIVVRDASPKRPLTWTISVVPGLFVLLSLDEVAMFHERLGDWLRGSTDVGSGVLSGPWVLIFVPVIGLLTVAAAIVFRPYLRGRSDVVALAIVGFAMLGFSAVGLELAGNFPASGSLLQKLLIFAEEIGEMLAANMILWSAVLVVQHEGIRIDLGSRRSLQRVS